MGGEHGVLSCGAPCSSLPWRSLCRPPECTACSSYCWLPASQRVLLTQVQPTHPHRSMDRRAVTIGHEAQRLTFDGDEVRPHWREQAQALGFVPALDGNIATVQR